MSHKKSVCSRQEGVFVTPRGRSEKFKHIKLWKFETKYFLSSYQVWYQRIRKIKPNMKIFLMMFVWTFAHTYRYIARKNPIPTHYCIVKNCHNCARSFNHNFGTRASRAVCTAMYYQAGCCDFYIKRSKGIQF